MEKNFKSDNCATVHAAVMQRLSEVNVGHVQSYGEDEYTESVQRKIEALFGGNCSAWFVPSGSAANVTCLAALCPSYGAVICTDLAHINTDETGAFEHLVGGKLYTVRGDENNKLIPEKAEALIDFKTGVQHHNQPRVISITECTETGTAYAPDEVRTLADIAHSHGLKLHMDGARLANAIAYLGCTAKELTVDAGVDALSFGMSKNGGMIGEAAVFFTEAAHFPYVRKNCGQLISKNRFIAAQFEAMLENGLWLDCAKRANAMAKRLGDGMCALDGVSRAWPTEGNEVFLRLPHDIIEPLREFCGFFDADEGVDTVRLVASHDTEEAEVDAFIAKAAELIG